jgi:hypothetical protein
MNPDSVNLLDILGYRQIGFVRCRFHRSIHDGFNRPNISLDDAIQIVTDDMQCCWPLYEQITSKQIVTPF